MKGNRENRAGMIVVYAMPRFLFLALVIGMLSSCSTQSARVSAQPTKQQVNAALATAVTCIKSAIVELDDYISNAETVGRSAVLSCSAQVDVANRMYLRANLPEQADDPGMLERMKNSTNNIATSLVLKNRAQSR